MENPHSSHAPCAVSLEVQRAQSHTSDLSIIEEKNATRLLPSRIRLILVKYKTRCKPQDVQRAKVTIA
eukprot:1979552-Amphidinium_carterae.1